MKPAGKVVGQRVNVEPVASDSKPRQVKHPKQRRRSFLACLRKLDEAKKLDDTLVGKVVDCGDTAVGSMSDDGSESFLLRTASPIVSKSGTVGGLAKSPTIDASPQPSSSPAPIRVSHENNLRSSKLFHKVTETRRRASMGNIPSAPICGFEEQATFILKGIRRAILGRRQEREEIRQVHAVHQDRANARFESQNNMGFIISLRKLFQLEQELKSNEIVTDHLLSMECEVDGLLKAASDDPKQEGLSLMALSLYSDYEDQVNTILTKYCVKTFPSDEELLSHYGAAHFCGA